VQTLQNKAIPSQSQQLLTLVQASMSIADDVQEYIDGVLSGRIVTGRLERLAVHRHVDDLVKAGDRGYEFNEKLASKAIAFSRLCNHYEGEWAGKPLILRGEQMFMVWCIFGWRQKPDGLRRFRQAQIEVGRKAGKSLFASFLAIYLSLFDDPVERGAQGYVAATRQEQATIVWKCTKRMIEQSPAFSDRSKITPSRLTIEFPGVDSIFRPIASDSKTVDGFNPHFIIKDEEHAYREQHRGLVDTLASGFGARSQPITITITTYGDDTSTIWRENHDYAVRCLESVISGDIVDDSWFAMICALDYPLEQACFRCQGESCAWCDGDGIIKPDDPYNELIWRKANPGIGSGAGHTPKIERMRESALMAKQRVDKQSEFFQKNLNIIVSSRQRVIMPEVWEMCSDELSDWSEADGINGGFDLGAVDDFSAVMECASFTQTDDDGEEFVRYEFFGKSFTAIDRKEHMQLGIVDKWISDGVLSASPGNAVDYASIESYIVERAGLHTVGTWAFDRNTARQMGQSLLNTHGIQVFEFTQAACHYNEPIKTLLTLLTQTRMVNRQPVRLIRHNGCPVLAWQASNLIIRTNAKGERMPDKSDGTKKIDAMVAMLMAFSERLYSLANRVPDGRHYLKNEVEFA
jgi:phage terminase large subunit-like protein